MKKFLLLILITGLCFLFEGDLLAQPKNARQILFIFDASGSMWGKLDNSTKIQVAKETMEKFAVNIPADAKVGLIAYGHHSASDCNDIELLLPVAPFDKTAFNAKIKALNPKGKTPIARSITKALEAISSIAGPVTIILVSDGLETCDGNACQVVKDARSEGIMITMHVVGFGIAEKDLSPLECIAQAGGGRYFSANNAGELSDALEKTVAEAPAGNAFLSVKATLEGKLTDASVRVIQKGNPKDIANGRTYESSETNPRLLQIPAGTYDVTVEALSIESRPTHKFEALVIKANDTLDKEVSFDQGSVEILVTRNGELSDATIQLFAVETGKLVTATRSYNRKETNPSRLNVPPGNYNLVISSVEIQGKPEKKFENITLGISGNLAFKHDFESGELSIGTKQGGGYVDATVSIVNLKSGKVVASGRTYQSAENNPKRFVMEPGSYRVDLTPVKPAGLGEKSINIEITTKGLVERMVEW